MHKTQVEFRSHFSGKNVGLMGQEIRYFRPQKEGINEQFRMIHSRSVFENQCIGDQEGNGMRTLR